MDHAMIAALKTLTDPERLQMVGCLAGGPATVDDLVASLGIRRTDVVRHMGRLRAAGIIGETPDGRLEVRRDTLIRLGRDLDGLQRQAEHRAAAYVAVSADVDPEEARVLRAFIVDGRLASIPATEKKRLVVLRYLREQCFADDRAYPEKEVNQRLGLFHPDVAALRRYMVDARLMTRDAGEYRRPVDDPA
jgi:hypothetical protein